MQAVLTGERLKRQKQDWGKQTNARLKWINQNTSFGKHITEENAVPK